MLLGKFDGQECQRGKADRIGSNDVQLTLNDINALVQLAAEKVRSQLSVELGAGDIAKLAKAAETELRERPQTVYKIVMMAARVAPNISKADIAAIAKEAETEYERRCKT